MASSRLDVNRELTTNRCEMERKLINNNKKFGYFKSKETFIRKKLGHTAVSAKNCNISGTDTKIYNSGEAVIKPSPAY